MDTLRYEYTMIDGTERFTYIHFENVYRKLVDFNFKLGNQWSDNRTGYIFRIDDAKIEGREIYWVHLRFNVEPIQFMGTIPVQELKERKMFHWDIRLKKVYNKKDTLRWLLINNIYSK